MSPAKVATLTILTVAGLAAAVLGLMYVFTVLVPFPLNLILILLIVLTGMWIVVYLNERANQ